ncbi:response regulator [Bacillus sp. 1P02SD]|uniref:response regulator transcription factor n=1 Tax=Bacillus sp. 1P02SD TaxID=3132264 RepID=UPI0039A15C08
MYSVILVDDDYLVLEYLKKMIPWEDLGFFIVGVFQESEEALNYLKVEKVDLIITDIGMPILNGIELVRKSKEIHPECHSIIISCHEEFDFAKQALRLNVFEYILKESMVVDEIAEILKRIKEKMDEDSSVRHRMEIIKQESRKAFQGEFIKSLLEGKKDINQTWKEMQRELGINPNSSFTAPIICFVNEPQNILIDNHSFDLLTGKIENVVNQLLRPYGKCICILFKEVLFLFLVSDDLNAIKSNNVMDLMALVQNELKKELEVSISCLIGNNSVSPDGIREHIKSLEDIELERFYLPKDSIKEMTETNFSSENIFSYYMKILEELKTNVLNEDKEQLGKTINYWIFFIIKERYHPDIVKEMATKLILDMKSILNSIQQFTPEHFNSNHSVTRSQTIYDIQRLLVDSLNELVDLVKNVVEMPKRNEIAKAQKYVLMNLDKKITLQGVADYLHLNPSYFSRLYKKSTHENFIDFVNKTKMAKAIELLNESNESVVRISEMLGFDSKSYFFKTFKKYVGMSPSEYISFKGG